MFTFKILLFLINIVRIYGHAIKATESPYCASQAIAIGETIMGETAIADDKGLLLSLSLSYYY